MNEDGQYLSHSDAEQVRQKKPHIKKFGNPGKIASPVRNHQKDQRGFANPGALGAANLSDVGPP